MIDSHTNICYSTYEPRFNTSCTSTYPNVNISCTPTYPNVNYPFQPIINENRNTLFGKIEVYKNKEWKCGEICKGRVSLTRKTIFGKIKTVIASIHELRIIK